MGRGNAAPILAPADEKLGQGLMPVQVELMEKDMAFDDPDSLAGWVRTIRHLYLERLPEGARTVFVTEVVSRYVERYPSDDGRIHVPMVRLEVEAKDPEWRKFDPPATAGGGSGS